MYPDLEKYTIIVRDENGVEVLRVTEDAYSPFGAMIQVTEKQQNRGR